MSTASRPTILLVEDNPADVFLFRESLRNNGIECDLVHIESGDAALRYLKHGGKRSAPPPDLIVLDLHLPGLDGNEILREIHGEPWLQGVPIAILSGAPPERLSPAELVGSRTYIQKSMDVREYIQKVGGMVRELCGIA